MDETLRYIQERVEGHLFTQHVVVNVAKVVNMQGDEELRRAVEACDIVNIDGMGVVFGARLLGFSVEERVAGIDLFERLLRLAEIQRYPVYFLGAKADVVQDVVRICEQRYPGLVVAGFYHGYFWNEEERIVRAIGESGARLLFVAVPTPLKENFINRWRGSLGVDFVMGVGGSFDVFAGRVSRAPIWMQTLGLEWLYRLMQEPSRMWRRYATTNLKFVGMVAREKMLKARR